MIAPRSCHSIPSKSVRQCQCLDVGVAEQSILCCNYGKAADINL